MFQTVGGSGLSGAPVRHPRCGRAPSSIVSLGLHSPPPRGKGMGRVRSLEVALSALGSEDVAAKMEVEAALQRAKEEQKSVVQPHQVRWTPDAAVLEHARFRGSVEGNGRFAGPEVDYLRDALKKARQAAQERPLTSQMTECRRFIERSERRLEKINAEREAETVQLEEARNLKPQHCHQRCRGVPLQWMSLSSWRSLRAKLVATELERDEARSVRACKRQATAVVREGTPIPESSVPLRLREDFVPMCEEDIFRWIQDRQADIQDATSAGNGHEVARLCHVLGTAATSWSTPTPSMVSNAVQR